MASSIQVEFIKVLACVAWADREVTNTELNFIKQFVRQFDLSGEEWTQVEMYLAERVEFEETKQVIRRFLARVSRKKTRMMLLEAVREIVAREKSRNDSELEWLRDLEQLVAEARRGAFFLDGLRSLARLSGTDQQHWHTGREAEFHDFIHNRALFKLRRRLGGADFEKEGSPEKLKKLTLCGTLLAEVGYIDNELGPEEEACVTETLRDVWGASTTLAQTISRVASEAVGQGVDLHRILQEVKATMSPHEQKRLVQGMFAMAKANGRAVYGAIERIRSVAYGLDFSHKEFIEAKLSAL